MLHGYVLVDHEKVRIKRKLWLGSGAVVDFVT
jgi:hypothetical protein